MKSTSRPDLSREVYDAAQQVIASGPTLTDALNRFIGRFVGWPFAAASGSIGDHHGNVSGTFSTVIYAVAASSAKPDGATFAADIVGAVIDAYERLDLETLNAAYARVALAKRLKKSPAPNVQGAPTTNVTLGIIFALGSALPLEKLAYELDRLNLQTPGRERPDMVVVGPTGTINYAVQFPGGGVSGDFLPPAEGAPERYTVPAYVIMVIRPMGSHTLNKMLAFLVAHLAIFSPGSRLPNWGEILMGVSQLALTITAYQYNQRGDLVPVPPDFYKDRYLPSLPVRIEDEQGRLLSTLQFLPWQDGGAILLRGKLPLEGLLLFLGQDALQRGGVIRLEESQISYVLPITNGDFAQMLARIHRQSNMVVRPEKAEWVLQKMADEGSRSPFMCRLYLGILRLRDIVYPDPTTRETFDRSYEFAMDSLLKARAAMRQLGHIWEEHACKVDSGEVAHLQGQSIHVSESIDKLLEQQIDTFLNAATRALKTGMQDVAAELRVNIGFLFRKQTAFNAARAKLQRSDPALAEYLRETRGWSETLLNRRNALEHEGWTLPRVTYTRTNGGVKAHEPSVAGQSVRAFVTFMFDRLTCFVEEITAHCLRGRMPPAFAINEIPPAERPEEMPERFRVTLSDGGMPRWTIAHHASSFEET